MKNKENKAPQNYSLDEILAEAKNLRDNDISQAKPVDGIAEENSDTDHQKGRFSGKSYEELIGEPEDSNTPNLPPVKPAVQPMPPIPAPEQPILPQPMPEISNPVMPEIPQPSQPVVPSNGIRFEQEQQNQQEQEQPPKKRGLSALFGRKHKKECVCSSEEEDVYYGMQLKPIDEYKKGYNDTAADDNEPKLLHPSATFAYLFDQTNEDDVGDEIAARFEEMHRERQKQVEKIRPLYDSTNMLPNGAPKPAKADTEKEIFSNSPKMELENPQPVKPEPQKPQVKSKQKATSKPAVIKNPVNEQKTTEFFMQIHAQPAPPENLPEVMPQVQPAKLVEAVKKAEEPVEQQNPAETIAEELPVKQPIEQPLDRKQMLKLVMEAAPKYLPHGKPVNIIELDNLKAVLESEAQGYQIAVKEEPKEKPHIVQTQPKMELNQEEKPQTEPDLSASSQVEDKVPPKSKKNKRIHKFNIAGEEEEDDDPQEELPQEPEELDDYNSPEDAPSISNELSASIRELILRFMVTGISTILLLIFGFLGEKYQLLPFINQIELNPTAYLVLNISFLVIAMAFCWVTIANGIKALFSLQANSDSGVAVAAIAVLIQSVAVFFAPDLITNGTMHLYSSLAVAALFLNSAGKLSMAKRINRNFHFISAPEPKLSVELYDDYNTALQMSKGCVADNPVIAYQCKTKAFKDFLKNSYEPDPSETASQSIAPVGFLSSLVLCIVCLVMTKDVNTCITVFAAATCVCTPITNMLSVNLPMSSLCAFARKCGAMLVGYQTVEHFSNTNAVLLDAQDLFPKGTVVLNGIKTFGGQRIDEAILDATALMCSVGGPLSDVFDQIIKSRHDMLPKIDNPIYEDERGVMGWVSGRRILVGNRDLMAAHGIDPPSRDYEEKYLLGGKQIVYLASGGDLVAMFVLSYNSDKRRALELQRMENNGISLIVRTCDPNITPEFLATCFQLDVHSVCVLSERLGSIYKEMTVAELPKAPALLATKGRQTTMLRMLTACVRQKSNVSIAVAMQNVAIVLGFALVAFLACYSGLKLITTASVLAYETFWLLAILLIPKLRKP